VSRVASFGSGLLFALGLALGGMTDPRKVIGFLDFADGSWDPSLAFVMVGAIAITSVAFWWTRGRARPLWAERWSIPTRRDLDGALIAGAALFGVGWGLGGFCPGPGFVSLVTGSADVWIFVLSMLGGLYLGGRFRSRVTHTPPKAESASPASGQPVST
jgi:uncharacterized protein